MLLYYYNNNYTSFVYGFVGDSVPHMTAKPGSVCIHIIRIPLYKYMYNIYMYLCILIPEMIHSLK